MAATPEWKFNRAWRNVPEWEVEDWADLYRTLRAFKVRVMRRHFGGENEMQIVQKGSRYRRRVATNDSVT